MNPIKQVKRITTIKCNGNKLPLYVALGYQYRVFVPVCNVSGYDNHRDIVMVSDGDNYLNCYDVNDLADRETVTMCHAIASDAIKQMPGVLIVNARYQHKFGELDDLMWWYTSVKNSDAASDLLLKIRNVHRIDLFLTRTYKHARDISTSIYNEDKLRITGYGGLRASYARPCIRE